MIVELAWARIMHRVESALFHSNRAISIAC